MNGPEHFFAKPLKPSSSQARLKRSAAKCLLVKLVNAYPVLEVNGTEGHCVGVEDERKGERRRGAP